MSGREHGTGAEHSGTEADVRRRGAPADVGRMTELERRYRRLLALYPAAYRSAREDEMVATYLAGHPAGEPANDSAGDPATGLATVGRLGFLDVVDVVRGAARQRVRANAATTDDARNTASTLALAAAVGLAAVWFVAVETGRPAWIGQFQVVHPFGPFSTVGAVAWLAWLGTGVLGVAGRARVATLVSLVLTVAVVPTAAFSGIDRPTLLVLVPQVALGLVAAAWPIRTQWMVRLFFIGGALVAVAVAFLVRDGATHTDYRMGGPRVMRGAAFVLLLCSVLAVLPGLLRGSRRMLSVLPILAVPAAFLLVNPIAGWLDGDQADPITGWLTGARPLRPAENWPILVVVTCGIAAATAVGMAATGGFRRRIRDRE